MKGNTDTLLLSSRATEQIKVENLIEALADRFYLNDSYFANMMVALTEAFNNALIHGNKQNPNKSITIHFEFTGKEMIFNVTDEGEGFDYWYYQQKKNDSASQRGLLLIESVSDKVEFQNNGRTISIHFNVASVQQDITRNRMNAFSQQPVELKKTPHDESQNH